MLIGSPASEQRKRHGRQRWVTSPHVCARRTAERCLRPRQTVAGRLPNRQDKTMKRFLIEREIPGASDLTEEQLAGIAAKSNDVVASLGVPYRWITSYVAGDKIYCVHEAEDEDTIREHAR